MDQRFPLTIEQAAVMASQSSGLDVSPLDIRELLDLGILPNFGTVHGPKILPEHARLFGAKTGTSTDIAFASLRVGTMPGRVNLDRHVLLIMSPCIAISFDPQGTAVSSLQAFIRYLRSFSQTTPVRSEWHRTLTAIPGGPCVWAFDNTNAAQWARQWQVAESTEARTSLVESLCVPSLYGNKARISSFIVAAIRQHLNPGSSVCDLMSGTGIITRHLLDYYPVHANDAALFAATLTTSQAVSIDQARAEVILRALRPHFDENVEAVRLLIEPAIEFEEGFLVSGLSSRKLADYREFTLACTRFVPEHRTVSKTPIWSDEIDTLTRSRITTEVQRGRQHPHKAPFLLATAYWGNCYFGIRQAVEVDSLRYAIDRIGSTSERPLLEAILLASSDACASGPHYAQPPQAPTDRKLVQLIERRARSVYAEFEQRLLLAGRRPAVKCQELAVTNLLWREALQRFGCHCQSGGVYVDPPYTRLQYSRYYHVFDTLLRYDYPACLDKGRTSQKANRFSSRFDSRESSVTEEFQNLFQHVRGIDAVLFLSYSTGATVPIEKLLPLVQQYFGDVAVYTVPIRHHSQGVPLRNHGHQTEVLIVGHP